MVTIGFWTFWQLFGGMAPLVLQTVQTSGIAYGAHSGGLAAGLVITLALRSTGMFAKPILGRWNE